MGANTHSLAKNMGIGGVPARAARARSCVTLAFFFRPPTRRAGNAQVNVNIYINDPVRYIDRFRDFWCKISNIGGGYASSDVFKPTAPPLVHSRLNL